jgi:hypothetical protein
MFPFVADAEERVLTLRDRVMAAGKAFNEVKAYYGEGDDRFDPTSNAEVFGRPTSLEFFGVFKTFVTSYNVSLPRWSVHINFPSHVWVPPGKSSSAAPKTRQRKKLLLRARDVVR